MPIRTCTARRRVREEDRVHFGRSAEASAFASEDWRVWSDTLFETLGVSVTVADLASEEILFAGHRVECCDALLPGSSRPWVLAECFPELPHPTETVSRVFCRSGLPCYLFAVVGGVPGLHVILSGFVTSTRERRRLFEQIVGRGASETEARAALSGIPVYSHKRAIAMARMVATHAASVLAADSDRADLESRAREMGAMNGAMRLFLREGLGGDGAHANVLEFAMSLAGASEGALMVLRPGTDILEVAAVGGEKAAAMLGTLSHIGEGVAGHVAQTRRSMLVSGADGGPHERDGGHGAASAVCVPLIADDDLVGVVSLGFHDPARCVSATELSALEAYAELAASGLRSAAQTTARQRDLLQSAGVIELARLLQGDVVAEDVADLVSGVLEKSIDFRIGGVILAGHSLENATVFVRGDVSSSDLDSVAEEAAGAPIVFDSPSTRLVTREGRVVAGGKGSSEWTVLAVPLTVHDIGIGHVFVASDRPGTFDAATERLLWLIAAQAGPAFDRATLFERLRDDYTRTLAALSTALDANERREAGHSQRVMDYSIAIGEEMGLGFEDIEILRFAGLLHDIGKVGVSEEILLKPSKLSDEEMRSMRLHSQIGAGLLEQVEFLNSVAPIVLHHHERWDGEGYPMRLSGDGIPALARILAVADAYDAMTSGSVYKKALSSTEARRGLERAAGTQFDPGVVAAMSRVLDAQVDAGLSGLLSDSALRGPSLPA